MAGSMNAMAMETEAPTMVQTTTIPGTAHASTNAVSVMNKVRAARRHRSSLLLLETESSSMAAEASSLEGRLYSSKLYSSSSCGVQIGRTRGHQ